VLQRIVQNSSDDTLANTKQNAKEILKEFGQPEKDRTIRCVDVPFIRKGDKVKVVAGTLMDITKSYQLNIMLQV